MAELKQSTAYTRVFFMTDATDHISGKAGATVTVSLSKAGGAFEVAGGTVSEISAGFYKIALTSTDTNTLGDLAFRCTAVGCDDTAFIDQVVDPLALLKQDWDGVTGEAARCALNALRALRNKVEISGTTMSVKKENDVTEAWSATITTSAGAYPITAIDPT